MQRAENPDFLCCMCCAVWLERIALTKGNRCRQAQSDSTGHAMQAGKNTSASNGRADQGCIS